LGRLAQAQTDTSHPLLEQRLVKKIGYILITSDRGLCGGFNANLIRMTRGILEEKRDADTGLVTVGRKGNDYFNRRKAEIISRFVGLGDNPDYNQASKIADEVMGLYTTRELDEV